MPEEGIVYSLTSEKTLRGVFKSKSSLARHKKERAKNWRAKLKFGQKGREKRKISIISKYLQSWTAQQVASSTGKTNSGPYNKKWKNS